MAKAPTFVSIWRLGSREARARDDAGQGGVEDHDNSGWKGRMLGKGRPVSSMGEQLLYLSSSPMQRDSQVPSFQHNMA